MNYQINSTDILAITTACLILPVFSDVGLTGQAKTVDQACQNELSKHLAYGDCTGEIGQSLLLYAVPNSKAQRILLIGCGKASEFNADKFRQVQQKLAEILRSIQTSEAVNSLTTLALLDNKDIQWKIQTTIDIFAAANYQFTQLKSQTSNTFNYKIATLILLTELADQTNAELGLRVAVATAESSQLIKDLANLPGNICTPSYLAEQAEQLAKNFPLKVTVLEKKDMQKLGMGALLAVAQGSHQPPKLITLQYTGAAKHQQPIVFIGKGITFDSGGISLKGSANMDEMKYDMCGAATVLGICRVAATLQLPLNIVGIIPATENMPGGSAVKPGDIVTSMSGQTIEILNTDAEGRLILCDALTYAEQFNPAAVIDMATLTMAIIITLGSQASGLFGNDTSLLTQLTQAGEQSGERVWQLPIWEDYQSQLNSNFADMANIGSGVEAKSILAACFLSRYTKKYAWAHLDIAGTAWKSGKEKGATARPLRLLVQYLLNQL